MQPGREIQHTKYRTRSSQNKSGERERERAVCIPFFDLSWNPNQRDVMKPCTNAEDLAC